MPRISTIEGAIFIRSFLSYFTRKTGSILFFPTRPNATPLSNCVQDDLKYHGTSIRSSTLAMTSSVVTPSASAS
ncbi:hypothetical protein MHK_007887 [Candidatus Magnetomorum sp. HK-1]|nr:hypothetical protein MHK_007887 [Candidatus Magnetomorum sp. HK-1]